MISKKQKNNKIKNNKIKRKTKKKNSTRINPKVNGINPKVNGINPKVNGQRCKQKNGWIQIKIFGSPLERGYAHGFLLRKELQNIRQNILPFLVDIEFPAKITYEKYEKDCRENITEIIRKK